MTEVAKFLIEVLVEPKPGYDMLRAGGDEYLFMDSDDTTKNILVDADSVAAVLEELATGHWQHDACYGHGKFWRFKTIVSPDDGDEE